MLHLSELKVKMTVFTKQRVSISDCFATLLHNFQGNQWWELYDPRSISARWSISRDLGDWRIAVGKAIGYADQNLQQQ